MEDNRVRLDKWLWAARFFKTRAQASQSVAYGRVLLSGTRVKSARLVIIGDCYRIRKETEEFTVVVRGISGRRGPASEAALLYAETEESRQAREKLGEERRLARAAGLLPSTRPDKRERRQIVKFTRKDETG